MIVYINEIDRDYHVVVKTLKKEFKSIKQAEEWCRENKWSGCWYYIDRKLTEAANE